MRRAALGVLALVAACRSEPDPCAALAGKTCLAVRARGSMEVDQIEVSGIVGVRLAPDPARTPPVAGAPFSLPAVTAIDLGDFSGAFVIRVSGLRDGAQVGGGGLAAGGLALHERRLVEVELRGGDDAAVADAAPGDAAGPSDAAAVDAGSSDGEAPDACTSCGWQLMTSGVSDDLYGVWGAAFDDWFVVGGAATSATVLRGSGDVWSSEYHDTGHWSAVWGSAADNVYAASTAGRMWHWDGSAWSPGALLGGSLYGVSGAAANLVYACGTQHIIKLGTPNANDWQLLFNVETGWVNNFYGISVFSEVFLAGYRYTPSTGTGMVRFLAFNNWEINYSPAERMNAVWGNAVDNVYAVGSAGLIARRNMFGWRTEASQVTDSLNGVWGDGAGDVYTVGDNGLILRRDGVGIWIPEATPVSSRLRAVFGVGGVVYAVGDAGVILRKR